MSDKRPASELVNELLGQFSESPIKKAPSTGKNTVSHQTMKMPMALFEEVSTPEDVAALCSLFVSLIGTMAGSSVSSFAFTALNELWPTIAKEINGKNGVEQKHIDLVQSLIQAPLTEVGQEQTRQPEDKQKVPTTLHSLVNTLIVFGVACYTLGKQGKPIKFDTGFKQAVFDRCKVMLEAGGVLFDKGTIQRHLPDLIDELIAPVKAHYEEHYGE